MICTPESAHRQTGEEYTLYRQPIKWDYTGLQTISLYRLMDYFHSHDFIRCISEVYAFETELKRDVEDAGNGNDEYQGWENPRVDKLLRQVEAAFCFKDFPATSKAGARVYAFAHSRCTHQELYIRIVGLRETMEDELHDRKLIFVPGRKTEHCDRKDAFGLDVARAFPSAEYDIVEAGNCYAVGLNTACVFHLMRVVEKGIRALATSMAIPLPCTAEQWGRILQMMEEKIKEVEKERKSLSKIQHLQLYGECIIEMECFKNAWRNHVMHAMHSYGESEATKVMGHVKNFMQRLSREVSEELLTNNDRA
jgi:hypothetical protein